MEKDHDNEPTFNKLRRMTSFVIERQKSVDTLAYFQKYGKETEGIRNETERHFYIPQTNQQTWIITI
jgi:ABC-type transport system involved in cytochrome bd biosynthesis fused ATPase/permease subunit